MGGDADKVRSELSWKGNSVSSHQSPAASLLEAQVEMGTESGAESSSSSKTHRLLVVIH